MKHIACRLSPVAWAAHLCLNGALLAAVTAALANPTGASIARGAALASNPSASVLQIVNTPGTIINWQGFSIAAGETTRFLQLNTASTVLNRVVGGNPSDILGRLESNGRVFLINPNGIVFGGGAVVDLAGLIASTRNITDANFAAGNYSFSGVGTGAITLQSGAAITTSNYAGTGGGQVWLIAKDVTQASGSSITVPSGQVVLAAGTQVDVGTTQVGKMSFTVLTDGTSTINSLGLIAADRGAVGLFADFINHRGTVNAGNQGSVAMNATRELRLQGASQVNAPDGAITLRGGQLLEVEYESVVNADGSNGRISFESNNLLVAPSGNTHAVGGDVTFNQYQASQYLSGAQQQAWVTPVGHRDEYAIVYRRSDGNYVLRFTRTVASGQDSGNVVGLFEVVLDGRTGALLSGPTAIPTGSSEALAYNAARAASRAASYEADSPTMPPSIDANWRTAFDAAWDAFYAATAGPRGIHAAKSAAYNAANNAAIQAAIDATTAYGAFGGPLNARQAIFEVNNLRAALENYRNGIGGISDRLLGVQSQVDAYSRLQVAADVALEAAAAASVVVLAAERAAIPAKDAAISAADTARNAAQRAVRLAADQASNSAADAAQAAQAAFNATVTAGLTTFYSDGRNVPTLPPSSVPTSNGGSIAWFGAPNSTASGFNVRASTGAVVSTQGNDSGFALPMPDGTYLFQTPGSYDVKTLGDALVRTDTLASGNYATLVPSQLGGFSVIDASGGTRMQWNYSKDVAAYSPVNNATGAVGIASAFSVRTGVLNGDSASLPSGSGSGGGAVPPGPATAPLPPAVVTGRSTGGARFDGIAGCNFVCAEAARNLQAAVDALIVADANRAGVDALISADANRARVDALIDAEANRAAVDALISDDANRARSAADAQSAATRASNRSGPGSSVAQQEEAAADAVRALQRAAGKRENGLFASNAAILLVDQGEFRRLVQGNRLDLMTSAQRLTRLEQWLESEARNQALSIITEGPTASRANIILFNEIVGSGSTAERQAAIDDLARRQAAGESF